MTDRLHIMGSPGSPYTRKMLAILRYKRISYAYISRSQAEAASLPRPKVELLPTLYFPGPDGVTAAVDSTPLIRRLEVQYPERAVLPPDPALAWLDALIEDYADEWLTKAMFHYRWHFTADRDKAGTILPMHLAISAPEAALAAMKTVFTDRQVGRLRYVGSNAITAPVIEASYLRLIGILAGLLAARPFLFGDRPAAADFALYGQLTQLAQFDPTSLAVTLAQAPRVFAWVDVMEDLSGVPDSAIWAPAAESGPALHPLLTEIGRVYVPLLLANAAAIEAGRDSVETEIDGQVWVQAPFPYHVKCLAALRAQHAALDGAARGQLSVWLAGTGVDKLFA